MITNAYRALASFRFSDTVNNTFPVKTFKDVGGTDCTTANNGSIYNSNKTFINGKVISSVYTTSNPNVGDIGIFIGTGDTAPTPNDYVLESPLTSSDVSRTSTSPGASSILDESGNIIGVRRTVTYQNITNSNIVVKEIGTYLTAYYSTYSNVALFLIERTVLDEPVTLAPNDTITVAFDVTY